MDAASLALFGVAISSGLASIGSSLGSGAAASSATGLLAKEPEKFPQALFKPELLVLK